MIDHLMIGLPTEEEPREEEAEYILDIIIPLTVWIMLS